MDIKIQQYLDKYIPREGLGAEIGHGVSPMVKNNVVYVDPNEVSYNGNAICAHIKGRMEKLPFNDNSLSFVAMGDVLEHITNPIKGLKECARILKNKGILFILVPDKNKTFDTKRPITKLEHCIEDFKNDVAYNDDTHWAEWVELVMAEQDMERVNDKERQIKNGWLHHHVWDMDAVKDLVTYVLPTSKVLVLEKDLDRDNDKVLIIMEIDK